MINRSSFLRTSLTLLVVASLSSGYRGLKAGEHRQVAIAAAASEEKQVLIFPQFADGGGFATTFSFVEMDTTDSSAGILEVFQQNGEPREVRIGFQVGSVFDLVFQGTAFFLRTSGEGQTAVPGWARATAPEDAQGVATIEFRDKRGSLVTLVSVVAEPPGRGFLVPVRRSREVNTGIAVANVSDSAETIDITVTIDGRDTYHSALVLKERMQVAKFIDEFEFDEGDLPGEFSGTVRIDVRGIQESVGVLGLILEDGVLSSVPALKADH